jgi:hypothetical protein
MLGTQYFHYVLVVQHKVHGNVDVKQYTASLPAMEAYRAMHGCLYAASCDNCALNQYAKLSTAQHSTGRYSCYTYVLPSMLMLATMWA